MSRPPKCRMVEFLPQLTYFKPAGVPIRELTEVVLSVEELEAVRLKDLIGLEQEACAEKMGISRPTYHRILSSARQKIAEALINGRAIKVEGGNFRVTVRLYRCRGCGHQWEQECSRGPNFSELTCPTCKHPDVIRINGDGRPFNCHRWKDGKKI
ncbi:MAG: DUF134 domain-containing protein [Peptococcaceae bacterium]|nr:DUF134 domain-containing protein [Peptococcaceae bacterium]